MAHINRYVPCWQLLGKRGTMDDKFTDKLLKVVLIGVLIVAGIEALTLLLFPITLFIKVMME
jgi:hypothetical protein